MKTIKIYSEIGELIISIVPTKEVDRYSIFCNDRTYDNGDYDKSYIDKIIDDYKKRNGNYEIVII